MYVYIYMCVCINVYMCVYKIFIHCEQNIELYVFYLTSLIKKCLCLYRHCYYERRHKACSRPDLYYSSISDGMAQLHTELPVRANVQQFNHKLKCHLQGYIGKNVIYYLFLCKMH